MQASARNAYLQTQVMTATPQKLQLMLIDAAIQSAEKGRRHWQEQDDEQAGDALVHCQEVVGELLSSAGAGEHEISRRLAGIYLFLFRTLTEVQLRRDEARLDDVIRVLHEERETWRQVCEKFGAERTPAETEANSREREHASKERAMESMESDEASEGRLSLEA